MTYKLPVIVTAALFTIGLQVKAQTVSTLDDLTLPGADTDYATSLPSAQPYSFQSGLVTYYGVLESWGGYGAFNYTNIVDTVTNSFTNDKAAITGSGYNSSNYGVAYLSADWPANPDKSVLVGAKLEGAAAGSKVVGMYVTNATWSYHYMNTTYENGDWYKLVVRGYLNNAQVADSVTYTLGSFATGDTVLIKTWEWLDLTSLGNVDSLSFQVMSSDEYTPFYFAFDNLTTLDGVCPEAESIAATSVNENSATITWSNAITGFTTNYEVAVDQSATLAPTATATTVSNTTYTQNSLASNTMYYVHVRAACDDGGFSAWDTASFKTLQGTGIFQAQRNELQVSISPNPATDMLTLHSRLAVNAAVYGIEGRELLKVTNATRINIASLPAGIYLLKVTDTTGGKQTTLRFTKYNQ